MKSQASLRTGLRKIFRIVKWGVLGMLVLVLVLVLLVRIMGWMNFRQPDDVLLPLLEKSDADTVYIDTIAWAGGPLAYAAAQHRDSGKPNIVFVHGCPGSMDAFLRFMTGHALTQEANLYVYDRPGYGGSGFGNAFPAIQDQAAALNALMDTIGGSAFLVGHSLGGPIIGAYAADYPEKTLGIMIIAGSVDPDLEPATWWRKLFTLTWFEHLLPVSFCVCNREILPLKAELQRLKPKWSQITAPTVVIHGERDRLVPFENMGFVEEQMGGENPPVCIAVEGENHFILWTKDTLISQILVEAISAR